MAKPFTLDLLPGASETLPRKPGWHKRALAGERRHKLTTAPQKGDPRADAKAVDYARWLAARGGIEIPTDAAETRVDWQPTQHGYRPRAVTWHPAPRRYHPAARGMAQPVAAPLLRIELPHWDYEAPAVVESVLLEWGAPVVIETTRDPGPAETIAPCAPGGEPDAPAPDIVVPSAVSAGGETWAPHPIEAIHVAPDHLEPMVLCPAVGLPCKRDCGFRSGCRAPTPAVGIGTLISAGTIVRPDEAAAVVPMRGAAPPNWDPREAIGTRAPPEAIRGASGPLPWVHPFIPGRACPPVVLHAAPVL